MRVIVDQEDAKRRMDAVAFDAVEAMPEGFPIDGGVPVRWRHGSGTGDWIPGVAVGRVCQDGRGEAAWVAVRHPNYGWSESPIETEIEDYRVDLDDPQGFIYVVRAVALMKPEWLPPDSMKTLHAMCVRRFMMGFATNFDKLWLANVASEMMAGNTSWPSQHEYSEFLIRAGMSDLAAPSA